MVEGTHYAEFTLLKYPTCAPTWGFHSPQEHPSIYIGLVGAEFDVAGGTLASHSTRSWMLNTWNDFSFDGRENAWKGIFPGIKVGDTVGLLLDLEQRALSAYLNGSRRGVIVAPGMQHHMFPSMLGRYWDVTEQKYRLGELIGPLHWVADVGGGGSVRIQCKSPPPTPTQAELAAEETAFVAYLDNLHTINQPAPEWNYGLHRNGEPSSGPPTD